MLGHTEGRRRRDDRRWDGWMASLTQWTWVWASSGVWWWTRKPGVLQSMGLQRVRHDWVTELNWSLAWSITLLACEMTHAIQSSHTHTHTHTHTHKAETDVFLELSCFFDDSVDVGNLISGSSAFSKTIWNMWNFTVHVLLKPGLENFLHYFASMWDEYNCAVVCALFGIAFLRDWNENWPFPVLWLLLSFPNLLVYWVQHFHSIIF